MRDRLAVRLEAFSNRLNVESEVLRMTPVPTLNKTVDDDAIYPHSKKGIRAGWESGKGKMFS